MININGTVLGYIKDIEGCSNGFELRRILITVLRGLQNPENSGFLATSLKSDKGPVSVSDLITKIRIASIFEKGELFDSYPTYNSKKAVRSSGIKEWLGDLKYLKEFLKQPLKDQSNIRSDY